MRSEENTMNEVVLSDYEIKRDKLIEDIPMAHDFSAIKNFSECCQKMWDIFDKEYKHIRSQTKPDFHRFPPYLDDLTESAYEEENEALTNLAIFDIEHNQKHTWVGLTEEDMELLDEYVSDLYTDRQCYCSPTSWACSNEERDYPDINQSDYYTSSISYSERSRNVADMVSGYFIERWLWDNDIENPSNIWEDDSIKKILVGHSQSVLFAELMPNDGIIMYGDERAIHMPRYMNRSTKGGLVQR